MTPTHPSRKVLRRFFINIAVMASGCWHWEGAFSNSGYGSATWGGMKTTAHRVAYAMFVRRPSDDEVIDHLCRNIKCVNPAHLEAVSRSENAKRAVPQGEERERTRRAAYQAFLATNHQERTL